MRGWRALAVVALLGACAEAAPPVSDDGAGSRADSGRVLPDVDAALLDASDEDAPAADASEEDASDEDTRVADTSPEDASPEDAGEEDTSTAPSDVLIDDTFTRPPIDAGDEGDTAADAPVEDVSAEDTSSDIADAPADDTGSTDVAPDVPDPPDTDPVVYAIDESGREGCLRWTIRAEFDTFDFKADDFLVRYEVESECPETLIYRVEHFNDFFALAVHQDGALWTYLGLCPGEGRELNWTFRTTGEGVGRAYLWQAGNHEALLEQCGVVWDPDAEYTLVGYGARELSTADTYSEIYELTPPIPIRIEE